jgi:hypothetical protein
MPIFTQEWRPDGVFVGTLIPHPIYNTTFNGPNVLTRVGQLVKECEDKAGAFGPLVMPATMTPPRIAPAPAATASGKKPAMSEAARKKIAAAQRKRHAEKKRAAAEVGKQSAGGGAS